MDDVHSSFEGAPHVTVVKSPDSAAPPSHPDDLARARRILDGDEASFTSFVRETQPLLARLARTVVRSDAIADEVVQETWLAMLEGLASYGGRSALRTWVVRILLNRARTRAVREARTVPASSLAGDGDVDPLPASAFLPDGHWAESPQPWQGIEGPDDILARAELRTLIADCMAALPENQRLVIMLRDVSGLSSEEVCETLELSDGNQRVLLHRARGRVRAALEVHFGGRRPRC